MDLVLHQHAALNAYRQPNQETDHAIEPCATVIDWAADSSIDMNGAEVLVLSDGVGHVGQTPDDDAASWLRSWSQSGWERFDSAYREARTKAQAADIMLVVRPSAQGMLSDAVCTLNWCARGAGQDAMLLLDPMGWVVPSMMRDLEDHLDRIVELCHEMIAQGRVWGVMLRSIAWNEDQSGFVSASLDSGEPDKSLLISKLGPLLDSCPIRVLIDAADVSAGS